MNRVDDTIENISPYYACRADLGIITIWDDADNLVISLPASFPSDLVRYVVEAHAKGEATGHHAGQADKAHEIRRALGL